MATDRRSFLKQFSAGAALVSTPGAFQSINFKEEKQDSHIRVSQLAKPVAIAMWDFSWILRHHRYGEFEDWDMVLEGLAERGYNAIRISLTKRAGC